MSSPASLLIGKKLDGGWTVIQAIPPKVGSTGGNFSYGYLVESPTKTKAFLKAIDIEWAFSTPDPMQSLQEIAQTFNFERQICERCRAGKLDKVVTALADGKVLIDPANPTTVVHYLIFELANSDLRGHLDTLAALDVLWALKCLHHIATGLRQLHTIDIAHQDLKPSNVLVFNKKIAKVADLGRASVKGLAGPHDDLSFAGDPGYAPPEGLYGYIDPEWTTRRMGCDLYHLGSLVAFFFTRASMTASLLARVGSSFHPNVWTDTYAKVLPHLRSGFNQVVEDVEGDIPVEFRADLGNAVRQLCDPDPTIRGYPTEAGSRLSRFSLERYVSLFDKLVKRTEILLAAKGAMN